MRKLALLVLAAGALFYAAPASAIPFAGGMAQGYPDSLNRDVIQIRHRGHHSYAYGGGGYHHGWRRHHRHHWRPFRFHRHHHHQRYYRGW